MQLTDPAVGYRMNLNSRELAAFEERCNVLLVARQAIEALGNDHVELAAAHALEQRLVALTPCGAAALGSIRKRRPGTPALTCDRGLA